MSLVAEAEDLHEIIRNVAHAEGRDMTDMHAIADEILGMPVGDSTPLPGALRLEPTIILPPMHEGLNEPLEGKFYLPPFQHAVSMPRQVRRLRRHLHRLTWFVAGLTMCSLTFAFVVWYRW